MEQIIALLTDFGTKGQQYVAQMKGVISKINPQANIFDITHNITPYSVIEAAYLLNITYEHFPENTIYVCVVDPGVGTSREILALKTSFNNYYVGPNNGIFTHLDLIENCFKVENEEFFNTPVSNTFHGRDIMAPVAANIAKGVPLDKFGPKFEINKILRLDLVEEIDLVEREMRATIQYIDSFGNITTNIRIPNNTKFMIQINDKIKLKINKHVYEGIFVPNFAAEPEKSLLFLEGSTGFLEISINRGNASETLGLKVGNVITIFY